MKRILSVLLAFMISFSLTSFQASASEYENNDYVEERGQINLEHIDISLNNNEHVDFNTYGNNLFEKISGKRELKKLTKYLEEFPSIEKLIAKRYRHGEKVMALGYTNTEMVQVDDHVEPVKTTSNQSQSAAGPESKKGKFTFLTLIIRGAYINAAEGYEYLTICGGAWQDPFILNGENNPGKGYDYIYQACPESFIRFGHDVVLSYQAHMDYKMTSEGKAGDDYWLTGGDDNYLCLAFRDTRYIFPFTDLCTDVSLSVGSRAPARSGRRIINSYYYHTWQDMGMEASVSLRSDQQVTLNISPTKTDKYWKLYSYVSFAF